MNRPRLIISILCLAFLGVVIFVPAAWAQTAKEVLDAGAIPLQLPREEGTTTRVQNIVLGGINWTLGFIGLIFFIFIVYAGLLWMTSGGNEERAEKAKQSLGRALIGFVIVFFSLAISYGVTKFLETVAKAR